MKKVKNESAFSRMELTTVLCLFLILIAVGLYNVTGSAKSGELSAFKRLADNYVSKATLYKNRYTSINNTYYLDDIIKKGFIEEMISPFNKKDECDHYESRVIMDPSTTHKDFKLKCENYVIEGIYQKEYRIYKVGEWQESYDGTENIETEILYNYTKENEIMLDSYYTEKEFLIKLNKQENTSFDDISVIELDGIKVVSKAFYRTKELIKKYD